MVCCLFKTPGERFRHHAGACPTDILQENLSGRSATKGFDLPTDDVYSGCLTCQTLSVLTMLCSALNARQLSSQGSLRNSSKPEITTFGDLTSVS